jgi:hypothetical protein
MLGKMQFIVWLKSYDGPNLFHMHSYVGAWTVLFLIAEEAFSLKEFVIAHIIGQLL